MTTPVPVDKTTYEIKEIIADEFRRQFEETLRRSDALDEKIGLMLGFIFITIGLTIDKDLIGSVFQSTISVFIFCIGLGFIVVSVFSGICSIFFRTFEFGPDKLELYKKFNNERDGYIKGVIAGRLRYDDDENLKSIDTKIFFAKIMFITFSFGLVAIIILKIGCFGKLW